MRKHLRKYLPAHDAVRSNRWLSPFGGLLFHPQLWHLNRHSAAGAIAIGLFCGLIPGPFQMLGAAAGALLFRVNLPLALATTLYSNPLTIVPLYLAAFGLGQFALALAGHPAGGQFSPPPEYGGAGLTAWLESLADWAAQLGRPLALGLLLLGSLLALAGYGVVRLAWRLYLVRAWQRRRRSSRMDGLPPTPLDTK